MGRNGQWWDSKARSRDGMPKFEKTVLAKELSKNLSLGTPTPVVENDTKVDAVYRYFDSEEFADGFTRGDILISTLEKCRGYEDPLRGDRHEGHDFYSTGQSVTGNGDDPEFVRMAARAGIRIGPYARNVTIEMNSATTVLRDAYVLCTTIGFESNSLESTFGKYCVKIENPQGFFEAVSKSLFEKVGNLRGMKGSIIYKERYSIGKQPAAGPIGFVKPPDKYADQKEYRFLWIKEIGGALSPLVIQCPEAAQYVVRVK
ncbi:hypothetical protein [Pseudomonas serbica]|uniref:hypothetical protein n=1 Tax=Pseudomonas serbica TaxID=2965074 RepID=UPI0039E5F55D